MNIKPKFKIGDLIYHTKLKLGGYVDRMELKGSHIHIHTSYDNNINTVGYEEDYELWDRLNFGWVFENGILTINIREPEKVKQICVNYEYK